MFEKLFALLQLLMLTRNQIVDYDVQNCIRKGYTLRVGKFRCNGNYTYKAWLISKPDNPIEVTEEQCKLFIDIIECHEARTLAYISKMSSNLENHGRAYV